MSDDTLVLEKNIALAMSYYLPGMLVCMRALEYLGAGCPQILAGYKSDVKVREFDEILYDQVLVWLMVVAMS
jgi:hypothetical protein